MLILKYADENGQNVTGKGKTLDDDLKTRKTIDLVAESYAGKDAAAAMTPEARADFVAGVVARDLRERARAWRNEKAIRALIENADKETDL